MISIQNYIYIYQLIQIIISNYQSYHYVNHFTIHSTFLNRFESYQMNSPPISLIHIFPTIQEHIC